jgi:hypothetical protein
MRIVTALRMMDPRRCYAVTWWVHGEYREFEGTFRGCNDLIRDLSGKFRDGEMVYNIMGHRPGGREDTFIFPAACEAD